MAQKAISPEKLNLGRAILLATDALGMKCEGAFWLYDGTDKEWRFFLVTSFLEHMGPRQIYLKLEEALFKKLSERELEGFRIFICAPDSSIAKMLRRKMQTDINASKPERISVKVSGAITSAIVYRLALPLDERVVLRAQRNFRRISAEVAAA
jgi:hypothetical protein